jgi:class 3 adenylate cyclase
VRALRVGCAIQAKLSALHTAAAAADAATATAASVTTSSVQTEPNSSDAPTRPYRGGIGVATGQVCAALLGLSTVRCEYALVGDTVNLAARLATHAAESGRGMLACPATMAPLLMGRGSNSAQQLQDGEGRDFTAECVGTLRPKGKSSEVSVYQVHLQTLIPYTSCC